VVKSVDLLSRKHVTQQSHIVTVRNAAVEKQFIHLVRKVDTHAMITISILQQQLRASMCFVLSEKLHRVTASLVKLACRVVAPVVSQMLATALTPCAFQ
jgi:hypothetical protein